MHEADPTQQFPDMEPGKSPPMLSSVNGIGFMMYGRRDHDEATNTYIKSWCLGVFFIPLFILGAYRVADAEAGGWHCLGKVALSPLAMAWNVIILAALLTGISLGAWTYHTGTPNYQAGQKIAQAEADAQGGRLIRAARAYHEVAGGNTTHAPEAQQKLKTLLDTGIENAPADQVVGVIEIVIDRRNPQNTPREYPELISRLLRLINQFKTTDPRGALDLIDCVIQMQGISDEMLALRESLLLGVVKADPDDMEAMAELAMIYEARGEDQACIDLLEPYKDRLGDTQGARVLGQMYAARGQYGPAYDLLKPYTANRLEQLHDAEQAYETAINTAWDHQIDLLNQGQGPSRFYDAYDRADEAEQITMVDTYVQEQIADNPSILAAIDNLTEASSVVPVALDLGIVMLGRASSMTDPQAKRAELEQAEQTFLAIRGIAGEADEFKLYLGQVYFWLGRADEGRQLFDEMLESSGRSYEVLLAVSNLMREVGLTSEARTLAEEAYRSTTDTTEQYNAAHTRAIMSLSREDEIDWLRRADPNNAYTQATLNSTLGAQAIAQGRTEEAENYLNKAILAYEKLPEDAVVLNNQALAYMTLYNVNADPEMINQAVSRLDKAVQLEPDDSILMSNTASQHLQVAAYDLAKDRIDYVTLVASASTDAIYYLYNTDEERVRTINTLINHASIQQAMGYADRLMLVAPQSSSSYVIPVMVHSFTEDVDQLAHMVRRLEAVDIELTDTMTVRRAYYAGERDEKYRLEHSAGLKKAEASLGRIDPTADPTTFAYAVGLLLEQSIASWHIGGEVDADRLVGLAEQAYAAAPSAGSGATLRSALSLRVLEQVKDRDPALSRFITDGRRALDPQEVMILAARAPEPFAAILVEHPDVQRIAAMFIQEAGRFANVWSPNRWALVEATNPDAAEEAKQSIRSDEAARLRREITVALFGVTPNSVITDLWLAQMDGDLTKAMKALAQAEREKIPLPDIRP